MRWPSLVARIGAMRNAFRILVEYSEGKEHLSELSFS